MRVIKVNSTRVELWLTDDDLERLKDPHVRLGTVVGCVGGSAIIIEVVREVPSAKA